MLDDSRIAETGYFVWIGLNISNTNQLVRALQGTAAVALSSAPKFGTP
jgi:hypothetical protein